MQKGLTRTLLHFSNHSDTAGRDRKQTYSIMKQLKSIAALLFTLLMTVSLSSCEEDTSSHDYYTATTGDPAYYWVIDMDNEPGAGFDGSFTIQAWSLDGKRLTEKTSYAGKYTTNGSRIYVTWNHQSMNTMWEYTADGIDMIGSSNPSELTYLTFREGYPEFN